MPPEPATPPPPSPDASLHPSEDEAPPFEKDDFSDQGSEYGDVQDLEPQSEPSLSEQDQESSKATTSTQDSSMPKPSKWYRFWRLASALISALTIASEMAVIWNEISVSSKTAIDQVTTQSAAKSNKSVKTFVTRAVQDWQDFHPTDAASNRRELRKRAERVLTATADYLAGSDIPSRSGWIAIVVLAHLVNASVLSASLYLEYLLFKKRERKFALSSIGAVQILISMSALSRYVNAFSIFTGFTLLVMGAFNFGMGIREDLKEKRRQVLLAEDTDTEDEAEDGQDQDGSEVDLDEKGSTFDDPDKESMPSDIEDSQAPDDQPEGLPKSPDSIQTKSEADETESIAAETVTHSSAPTASTQRTNVPPALAPGLPRQNSNTTTTSHRPVHEVISSPIPPPILARSPRLSPQPSPLPPAHQRSRSFVPEAVKRPHVRSYSYTPEVEERIQIPETPVSPPRRYVRYVPLEEEDRKDGFAQRVRRQRNG